MAYALITKVLSRAHVPLVVDWLDFLGEQPSRIVAYLPDGGTGDEIAEDLRIATSLGGALVEIRALPDEDLKNEELAILHRLMSATEEEWIVTVNLDTLPHREGHEGWLPAVIERLDREDFLFYSGTGMLFAADEPIGDGTFLRTQRFSNNFAVIRRKDWMTMQDAFPADQVVTRFISEAAIEHYAQCNGRWGLRRRDTSDFRVFHVQQWGDALFEVRTAFKRGDGIDQHMNKIWEDTDYLWERHYRYPRPSRLKLFRIAVGKTRRRLFSSKA